MKKSGIIIASLALLSILLASTVLAAVPINMPAPNLPADYGPFTALAQVVKGAIDGMVATLNYALGGHGLGDIAIAKFLLMLIVIVVLYKPSTLLIGEDKKGLSLFLSILIGILGVNFLPQSVVAALILPYNTLGIVVAAIVPLFGLVFFLNSFAGNYPALRKVGYIIAGIAFFSLMIYRLSDPGVAGITGVVTLVYSLVILACLILFFFDGTLSTWIKMYKIEGRENRIYYEEILDLQKKLELDATRLATATVGSDEYKSVDKSMTDIRNRIKSLYGQIKSK